MRKFVVKLVLRNDKINEHGKAPIYLQTTLDGTRSFQSTGHFIPEKMWDKKAERVRDVYQLSDLINIDIAERKRIAVDTIVRAGATNQKLSIADLKTGKNFFKIAEEFALSVKNKRAEGTLSNYEKHLRKLEAFNGSRILPIDLITPEYLTKFEDFILGFDTNRRKDNTNYAHAVLKSLRRVFSYAEKKGAVNPFKDFEMPEYTAGDKDHLTVEELDKWTKFYNETKDPFLKEAALYFLFGCYSGLRISDWFLFDYAKQVHRNHIALRAKKNGEWVAIPLHKRLSYIIKEMKKIPLVSPEPNLNNRFKKIAEKCGINKSLSSHCGRKTFAVTMCLERGISSETAAELMGITLTTFVNAYSRVTPQKIRKETSIAWEGM
jgi:site-specific recombinase XerD